MRTRNHFDVAGLSAAPRRQHAVVVGGSVAGMLAARVLSDHFDAVTLLERDRFPESPAARKGLPQGRHAHGLLERGRVVMERFLPGLTGELVRAGAEPLDWTQDAAWMSPYGWYVRFPGDLLLLASTRDLIDWGVRRRVAALPNVRIQQGADVAGLILGPGDGARVAGVQLRSRAADAEVDHGGSELAADLVVVADGRNSRLPDWLTALGYEPLEETVVNSFQGYASRFYRRPAEFVSDWKALYIQQAPPADPRGGIVIPVEEGALARLAGRRRRRLPAHRRGWLPRLRPQPAEPGALRGDRGGRSVDLHRWPARNRESPAALRPPRAVPRRGRGRGRRRLRVQPGLCPGDDRRGAWSRSPGSPVAGGVVAPRSGSWSRLPASPGPGDRRRLAARRGRGLRFRTMEGPPQGLVARLTGCYIAGAMRAATRQPGVRRRLEEVLHLLRPRRRCSAPVSWPAWRGTGSRARATQVTGRSRRSRFGTRVRRFATGEPKGDRPSCMRKSPRADDVDPSRTTTR